MRDAGNVKTVLIDIDDTLLDFSESSKDAIRFAVEKTGFDLPPDIHPVFWKINSVLWEKVERGEIDKYGLYRIRWKTIFHAIGRDDLDGAVFEEAFYNRLSETAYPVRGAKEILAYLASKYALYTASNANHNRQRERLAKAGLDGFFTDFFVSSSLGANKPTAEFFDRCFERMEPRPLPEETVLIGDSISADISGGNAYGLFTVWYNHNRKPDPTDPALIPCVKVDSLEEIRAIL